MAVTIKDKKNNSSTPSVTGTPAKFVKGPPESGSPTQFGLYILQSGTPGTNGTYAWLEDVNQDKSLAAVSTFTSHVA